MTIYNCTYCNIGVEGGNPEDSFFEALANKPICQQCGNGCKGMRTNMMIAPQFQSYKAMAGDQRMIHSRAQHRDFLTENNLQEVGTDTTIKPT